MSIGVRYEVILAMLVVSLYVTDASLDQLGVMIKMKTGREGVEFSDYGRWCGFGGYGEPVDAIDLCCRNHDLCYDNLPDTVCGGNSLVRAYLYKYTWRNEREEIKCTDEEKCNYHVCECDRRFAQCLARHNDQYNKRASSMHGGAIYRLFSQKHTA